MTASSQENPTLQGAALQKAALGSEDSAFETFAATQKFTSLDGLRCFSIVAVIWHHYQKLPLAPLLPGARFGFLGVDLFFVISGFLIVTLLLRERQRSGSIHLKEFYLRRAFRIFPLYYGVLAFMALKGLLRGVDTPESSAYFQDLPVLLLYLSNWIPGNGTYALAWSLAAEEQFYLLWPPLERYFRKGAFVGIWVLLGISLLISLGLVDPFLERSLGWSADEPAMLRETTFVPILLGVLIAHLLQQRRSYVVLYRLLGRKWVAPTLFGGLFLFINALPADIASWPRLGVHILMAGLVTSCVIREDHGLRRLLTQKAIARIGVLSYGIYLLHHMGMNLGMKAARVMGVGTMAIQLLLGFLCVYLLAELSFRLFEARFVKLRAKHRP